MHTRARTPRPVNPGDDELARAAQRVRETYGVMIEDSGGCNEAHTDHDGSAAADPAPYTCHLRNAAGPASSPMDARPASKSDPSKFPPVTPEHGSRFARPARRSLASTESSMVSSLPHTREDYLASLELIATSPLVRTDITGSVDDDSTCDEATPLDDVESLEDTNDHKPGKLHTMLHLMKHIKPHVILY
ncbi:hypothetical protein JG687_00019467 [Phytophthora cactorum]|uniref:Uncharacterized protein n=1 Tax=Phytophthora cactorum TaxID=29920 RepID=A0A8T1TL17_9STRA|nr:hypothetical protein JG687_00019467 [Phytophthora cactorum]